MKFDVKVTHYHRTRVLTVKKSMNHKGIFTPNFLILGTQKGGTSAINAYLSQHPQICIPVRKEPSYFSFRGHHPRYSGPEDHLANQDFVTKDDAYAKLFAKKKTGQICGEGSVTYLYLAKTIENIRAIAPKTKFIVSLRNPADRAFSAYQHLRRDGREPLLDFEEALAAEQQRITDNWETLWHYKEVGFYGKQIERYLKVFPRDQFLFLRSEDIRKDTVDALKSCFEFLGVDESIVPDTSYDMNVSGLPKNQGLNNFLSKPSALKSFVKNRIPLTLGRKIKSFIQKHNLERREQLGHALRKRMLNEYKEDLKLAEELTGLKLTHWCDV